MNADELPEIDRVLCHACGRSLPKDDASYEYAEVWLCPACLDDYREEERKARHAR